ncbi:MAG: hypothetical protein Q4F53_01345 [Nesterenkonia sp.]|nr:hypothetical protein [Nesterenkonia sp.]
MNTDTNSPTSTKSTPSSTATRAASTVAGPSSSAAADDTGPQNDSSTPEGTEPQQPEEQPEGQPDEAEETEGGGNAEAAKYRRRLRDSEARVEELTTERDEATRALTELRDRIATEALEDALQGRVVDEEMRRIVLAQLDLANFRTEVGTVDRQAVADYAKRFSLPISGWSFIAAGQDRDDRRSPGGTSWSKLLGSG